MSFDEKNYKVSKLIVLKLIFIFLFILHRMITQSNQTTQILKLWNILFLLYWIILLKKWIYKVEEIKKFLSAPIHKFDIVKLSSKAIEFRDFIEYSYNLK